ncbi:MAG: signal peptide peptidase SppA [Deltaproteobacteria bacterium]|nr:MAG: signal peptide peptidase SppA [Deltaproteobacteria bacterium]
MRLFSRRHPLLFFFLMTTGMICGTVVAVSLLIGLVALEVGGDRIAGTRGSGEQIGVVDIVGVITDARPVIEGLRYFREQDDVKAIVVRIDSPGGGVGPSQEIYREIMKTTAEKKVVASLGSVAASGGYYAASAADGIMSNPGTVTGSIGVIMGYTNIQDIMEKIGLKPVVIKSGEFKDIGSPSREMRESERKLLQGFVDQVHQQFVADVCRGRGLTEASVMAIADGRIFSGERAGELGLVDRMGNFDDALNYAGELAGLEGAVEAVYPPKKPSPFMEYLTCVSIREWFQLVKGVTQTGPSYLYQPGS